MQWREVSEPYVKVVETIKKAALNPTAGQDLIIGAVIISDTGSSKPTLVKGQAEFLSMYSSSEITEDYMASLDEFYVSDTGSNLASTMWLNAYRLAGKGNLLIARAINAKDMTYIKPLTTESEELGKDYILRDGETLRKSAPFKFFLKDDEGSADGWAIAINEVGVLGNRVSDNGPIYDFYVDNLPDLISQLNETTKFFAANYQFYSDINCGTEVVDVDDTNKNTVKAVKFNEVYLSAGIIDKTDPRMKTVSDAGSEENDGYLYIIPATIENGADDTQIIIDLDENEAYAKFTAPKYFVSNVDNSSANLEIRIRRFNHDAVKAKVLSENEQKAGESPWTVLTNNIENYEAQEPNIPASILEKDFFEIMVKDPKLSKDEALIFNVGNIGGRGDVRMADVNDALQSMQITAPEDLHTLGLPYYRGDEEAVFVSLGNTGSYDTETHTYTAKNGKSYVIGSIAATRGDLKDLTPSLGDACIIGTGELTNPVINDVVVYSDKLEIKLDCGIKASELSLLDVTNSTIMAAWDEIYGDEIYCYSMDGVTDLGCTYPIIQNYIANLAISGNEWFYPVSTTNSTNYITIANFKNKITTLSPRLYYASPWDIDDGTVGFEFGVSPSTLYWETVLRNRSNNEEFAGVFGQNNGVVQPVHIAKEFSRKERQLLLSKNINTIAYDAYLDRYYFNDNKTAEAGDEDVLGEECNSRLSLRIRHSMPVLLSQFKGRQNTARTRADVRSIIDYFFANTILPMGYTIADYRVICDETNNTDSDAAAHKLNVKVKIRFQSSIKYITVYQEDYPLDVSFE